MVMRGPISFTAVRDGNDGVGIPDALLLIVDGLREQYIYSWMSIGIS